MRRYHPRHAKHHDREHGAARIKHLLYVAVVLASAAFVFAGMADATANGDQDVPDYDEHGQWPASMEYLCIEDQTGGFPIHQAAAEFKGFIQMAITDDCSGHPFVIHVATVNEPDMNWSGKWSALYVNDDKTAGVYREGWVQLNVAQAYRQTPHKWFLVLVHEFGHAAGLGWDDLPEGSDSVMVDGLIPASLTGLTEADREQLREIYDEAGR